jgi:L-arabinose isomerase
MNLTVGDLFMHVTSPKRHVYILETVDNALWAVTIRNMNTQYRQHIPFNQFNRWWYPLKEDT